MIGVDFTREHIANHITLRGARLYQRRNAYKSRGVPEATTAEHELSQLTLWINMRRRMEYAGYPETIKF